VIERFGDEMMARTVVIAIFGNASNSTATFKPVDSKFQPKVG
jgi:hypothetical protein